MEEILWLALMWLLGVLEGFYIERSEFLNPKKCKCNANKTIR